MENRVGYIYKITSLSNKIYIEQTVNIKQRFNAYKNMCCGRQITAGGFKWAFNK